MRKWNNPEVVELNINETANGFLNVNFEGPFDIIFGDGENKAESSKPSSPTERLS